MSSECQQKTLYTNIEKSKSDKFDCIIKILPNGLKTLIVSDPEAENSSASLGVNVGSLIDPPDELGLAHFCEHLLFMGTEKYPDENDYDEYLNRNGGESNAYTGLDKTVFYFDIDNEFFEGAIDRFSQFFISPKFNEGSVEREINAVDSEFKKNKNLDTWRNYQLFKSLLAKGSPFTQFSTGNKQTLNHPDIRDRLLKMYNKYYTSEIMNLVVYTKLPMNDITKLVDGLFSLVPKRENFVMPKYDEVKPFDETTMGNFIKVVPVKDRDKIDFIWLLPLCENYHAKPLNFLSSLFGHEGPNTLTASLKRDNLIIDLVCCKDNYADAFSTFEIEVELTKKGFENYKEVILRILKYIKIIQGKKINERYFNEEKSIKQLQFDFRDKKKPSDFTEKCAEYLILYKPEDIFIGNSLYKEYNEELIRKYLDLLNLQNLNITFLSKSLEKECDLTEKWYGTKYAKEKLTITNEEIESYKCEHIFDYPPENKFIPKNLEIFPIEENSPKYPEIIMNEENCKVWFLQDKIFKLPKGRIKVEFKFVKNLCDNSDIKNRVVSKLLKKIIKLELNETIYMASEANINFKIKIKYNSLEILIEGFNDSLKNGLEIFLTKIKNLELTPEKHKEVLDLQIKEYIKKWKNFFLKKSYKVCNDYTNRLLGYPNIDLRESIEFASISKIEIEDLVLFKNNMFLETQSRWLIQGNIKKETALEIVNMTNGIFNIDINKKINKPFYEPRVVELKNNINYIYRFFNPNKEEKDSSLLAVYQCGQLVKEEKQYFQILYSYLSDKFYDTLRTKETLGYVVYLTKKPSNEVEHLIGLIQSSVKCPEFCSSRVRNFFSEMEKKIKEISDEDFNSHLNNRIVDESKQDRDLEEQFNRNWNEITMNRFKFNRKEENIKYLKKCNKKGFIQFFEKYFVKEVKKLDVEYVCESHIKENEEKIKEQYNDNSNIKKRIGFDKISDFHACNRLYPSVSNTFYRELFK